MTRDWYNRRPRAVTLVEVVIAVAIMAFVAVGAMGALVVSTKMAMHAQEDMMALEFMNRQVELIKSSGTYSNLGVSEFDTTETFEYDPNFINNGPTFTVQYEWYGFGTLSSATNSTVTVDATGWPGDVVFDDGSGAFDGHYLILRDDNQIARITGHSKSGTTHTFTIDYTMNSWPTGTWGTLPLAGDPFEVDGGKWCRITINWNSPENSTNLRSVTREVFVPWRGVTS